MTGARQTIIVAHIPVLHLGYLKLLETYPKCKTVYILNASITGRYRELQKDIRVLPPAYVKQALQAWYPDMHIHIAGLDTLQLLGKHRGTVVLPDEDVSREIAETYFKAHDIVFYPVFLRWDREKSNAEDPIDPDAVVSADELDKQLLLRTHEESGRSSDIWRRVGALIAKDGAAISAAYNKAVPHEHTAWIDGDPRNNYKKGVGIELSIFMHAEARLIAEAAAGEYSLRGCDMYATTFPCPPCAMLIAHSGLKRLFYAEGYAVLNGKRVLQDNNVELIKVDVNLPRQRPEAYVAYPEK